MAKKPKKVKVTRKMAGKAVKDLMEKRALEKSLKDCKIDEKSLKALRKFAKTMLKYL